MKTATPIQPEQTEQTAPQTGEYQLLDALPYLKQELDRAIIRLVKLQRAVSMLEKDPDFALKIAVFDDLRYC